MLDAVVQWLLQPIDPSRAHDVSLNVAWHGRLMVLAWSILFPIGVLVARFGKILPRQKWPEEVDSQIWWRTHLTTQYIGGMAVLIAVALIWRTWSGGFFATTHAIIGWIIVLSCALQFIAGWMRGSHGGPHRVAKGEPLEGDHFLMTRRRQIFERLHKTVGYTALILAFVSTTSGMWIANGPVWMWCIILMWWALLAIAFYILQSRGMAIDTYQAIFGPDPDLPGNKMKPIGWGVSRKNHLEQ